MITKEGYSNYLIYEELQCLPKFTEINLTSVATRPQKKRWSLRIAVYTFSCVKLLHGEKREEVKISSMFPIKAKKQEQLVNCLCKLKQFQKEYYMCERKREREMQVLHLVFSQMGEKAFVPEKALENY